MKQRLTLEEVRAKKREEEAAYKAERDRLEATEHELEQIRSEKKKKQKKEKKGKEKNLEDKDIPAPISEEQTSQVNKNVKESTDTDQKTPEPNEEIATEAEEAAKEETINQLVNKLNENPAQEAPLFDISGFSKELQADIENRKTTARAQGDMETLELLNNDPAKAIRQALETLKGLKKSMDSASKKKGAKGVNVERKADIENGIAQLRGYLTELTKARLGLNKSETKLPETPTPETKSAPVEEKAPTFNAEEFEAKIQNANDLIDIYWILKEQKFIPGSEGNSSGELVAKAIYNLAYMAPELLNTPEKADRYLADKGVTRSFGLRAKVIGLMMFDLGNPADTTHPTPEPTEQKDTQPQQETTAADYTEKIKELEALVSAMQAQNLYERLGLNPGATKSQIEKAYKAKLKEFHPDDKPAELRSLYDELSRFIGEAGNTLKDKDSRERYDQDMMAGRARPGPQNNPNTGAGPQPPPNPGNGPQAPGTNDPLRNMEEAREKYAQGYKDFLNKKKNERNMFVRGFKKFTGWKFEGQDLPQELKDLETEYNNALIALGNSMYAAKAEELMNAGVLGVDKDNELKRYKQNEIFTEVVIKEQARLSALKVESQPAKERGLVGKGLGWYLKQPRWAKIAIATALSTALFATFVPGTVAAAGGAAGFAGMRFARGLMSSTVGQLAAKSVDFVWKDKSATERKAGEQALAQAFGDHDLGDILESTKRSMTTLSEEERTAKRNRLLTKAVVGLVAGGATSLTMGYASNVYASSHAAEELPNLPPKHNAGVLEKLRSKIFDQYETKARADLTHQPATAPAPAPAPAAEVNTGASSAASAEAVNAKPFVLNQEAVIQKGEGIEHAFRRQIMSNPALAEKLGFKEGMDLEKFSGGAAHKVAIDHGYVDKVTGEEIRIRGAGNVAYQTELGPNGEVKVSEYIVKDGKVIDESIGNNSFEQGADVQGHEYTYKGNAAEHATGRSSTSGTERLTISGKNIPEGPGVKSTIAEHASSDDSRIRELHDQMDEAYRKGEAQTNTRVNPEPQVNKVHVGTRVRTGTTVGTGKFANSHFGGRPSGENVVYRGLASGARTGQDHIFANLEDHEIAALENHPAFMSNPYELSGERLVEVYDTGMSNLREIFAASTNDHIWSSLRGENVKRILEYKLVASDDPAVGKLANYFGKLKEWSGLEPKNATVFHWRAESSEEYQARALQKLCASGKLEQFKASLNK